GELAAAVRDAGAGRVLAAVAALRPWSEAAHADARAAIAEAFAAAGVPAPAAGTVPVEVAPGEPLPRGTPVRLRDGETTLDGTVLDARGDELTVRVAGPAGYTFPTVARVRVEPVAP